MGRSRVRLEDWEAQRPDLDAEVQGIRTRLLSISARLARDNHRLARTVGLNGAELRVLYALRRAGTPFELRPTDLFESLVVPSGTMTRQIERLDRLGYVVRSDDPDDRRGARVRLTDLGRVVADDTLTVAVRDSRTTKCIDRLGAADRSTLARILKSLLAVMDEFDDRESERDHEERIGPA